MAKTAVGLFKDSGAADKAVRALESAGFVGRHSGLERTGRYADERCFKHAAHGF